MERFDEKFLNIKEDKNGMLVYRKDNRVRHPAIPRCHHERSISRCEFCDSVENG